MKELAFILLTLFVFSSCKKEVARNFLFEGEVLEVQSGNPVKGAKISILERGVKDGVFNPNFSFIKSVRTQSNGEYRLEVEESSASEYMLRFEEELYFEEEEILFSEDLRSEGSEIVDFDVQAQAIVKVTIENNNVFSSADYIEYQNLNAKEDCFCCDNDKVFFRKSNSDTSWTCIQESGHRLRYYHRLRLDSLREQVFEDFVLPHRDTLQIKVSY